jgi:hypothetical protein
MPKDKIINCKVEEEIKIQFEELCKENFSNPSQELYKFIRNYIKQHSGSKILISDLRKKV